MTDTTIFVDRCLRDGFSVVDIASGADSIAPEAEPAKKQPRVDACQSHPRKKLLGGSWFGFATKVGNPYPARDGNLCSSIVVPVPGEESEAVRVPPAKEIANEKKRRQEENKKYPKPPRPPKSQTLGVTRQKLMQEFSETAMLKHARIERIKALETLKNAKVVSSGGNPWALAFTILCCLLLIWEAS